VDAEYFRLLFDYNRWANARILDRAPEVAEQDYFAPFPGLSYGNLHGTLLHLVGSEMNWWRRWTNNPGPPFTVEAYPDLASLLALRADAEQRQASYFAALTDDMVNNDNTYSMPNGNQLTHRLGHQLGHWVNHAQQYRSEAAVRRTSLDLSPGGIDLAGWLTSRNSQ
jgi:uncharacterized damage-inducible protein DinB